MTLTCASICSGGKLADIGLMAAGYTPLWGVEYVPEIAEVARVNVPAPTLCQPAQEVRWASLERPTLLWASPPCPNFSKAKGGATETALDDAIAEAVCDALRTLTPPTFVLENVVGYRHSRSLGRIRAALDALGYWSQVENVNCADFGVPQTRRRLILRAVRAGFVPYLPAAVQWVGWYESIADLIPTLPESAFAPWQLDRLDAAKMDGSLLVGGGNKSASFLEFAKHHRKSIPGVKATESPAFTISATAVDGTRAFIAHPTADNSWFLTREGQELLYALTATGAGVHRAFILNGQNGSSATPRMDDEPMVTVTASFGKVPANAPRAFIVDGKTSDSGRLVTVPHSDEPVYTITASANKQNPRAWLSEGRVVAMTPRALARFQSVPDTYQLPESRTLAARIIGNGVPPLLAQRIGETLRGAA